jgi:hypothetical protein
LQLKRKDSIPPTAGKAVEKREAAIAERKRQAAEWDQANPGLTDP